MAKIRNIDVVWLLLLAALAALGLTQDTHSPFEWAALLGLGVVQIAEGHLGWAESRRKSALAIVAKLALCYLFVVATGGIESSYYLILFLPIVSGASTFGLTGTLLTTTAAGGLYLSTLLYVLDSYYVPPDGQRELVVRILFFFLMAILVNRLATENRMKTERLSRAYEDLSKAEAEVRRSERLAALGQLSAGLAHEIRNPLGVISASAEVLAKQVSPENEVAREMAGFIGAEVNRTNALVTRFLDFARPLKPQLERNDLNAVVRRTVKQLEDGVGPEEPPLRVETELDDLPPFAFDKTLVESTVLNLLVNAKEAMPAGGDVRVETRRNGESALLTVTDSGSGIPADKLEDVFNPFYTTKPTGVGLGLAMVSKFIDSHGGKISVESPPGKGAKFRVELPLTQEE